MKSRREENGAWTDDAKDWTNRTVAPVLTAGSTQGRWYMKWSPTLSNEDGTTGSKQTGCRCSLNFHIAGPTLFKRYVRLIISAIYQSRLRCNIGGMFVNLFTYADDMILLPCATESH